MKIAQPYFFLFRQILHGGVSPFSDLGILANENLVSKTFKEHLLAYKILQAVWNQYADDRIKSW